MEYQPKKSSFEEGKKNWMQGSKGGNGRGDRHTHIEAFCHSVGLELGLI
jgi:hypothetical protein